MSGDKYALLILVVAALTVTAFAYRRRRATTHDTDEKIFRTAPRWAGRLNEKLESVLAGQRRLNQQIGREARADERRDFKTMATQAQVLEKVAEATSVSKAANILVKEAIRLLKEGQSDPAKNDEAIALLEGGIADDNAVLTENTPEA